MQRMVRDDLYTREQLGIDRYGMALFAHNGRDALVDAYQEALDLACYLRQLLAERGVTVEMIVDQPAPYQPGIVVAESPEQAACRQLAEDEKDAISRRKIIDLLQSYDENLYPEAATFMQELEQVLQIQDSEYQ